VGWPRPAGNRNAQQVRRIVSILHAMNLEVAKQHDAREMLRLKGRDPVAF
jgi:uncharacterized protein (DUF849 family)